MTIYDAIGGADAVAATVEEFYQRVLADDDLDRYFSGADISRLKAHQRSFIAAAIGGPDLFSGQSMRAAHAGLRVRPADFDRVVSHLVEALAALGVSPPLIHEIGARLAPLRDEIAPAFAAPVPSQDTESR